MKKKVRAIIIKDGSVLLIYRSKHGQEYFVFPGGSIEKEDKDDMAALIRECKEELGVDVSVGNLITSSIFDGGKEPQQEMFYFCSIISGELGTGNGPEFQGKTGYEGTYTLCWVSRNGFEGKNIQPANVAVIVKEMM
ncbi:MAG: NUDIX domain-containing protein [Patescibacteria group bacterium]